MQLLTPDEVLKLIQEGKQVEVRWSEEHDWEYVLPNQMIIDELIDPEHQFRLAQEMITIGDVSFPKPESSPLRKGTTYFYPNFIKSSLVDFFEWTDDELDFKLLKLNMLHLSEENAIAHAKALIKLSGGNYE